MKVVMLTFFYCGEFAKNSIVGINAIKSTAANLWTWSNNSWSEILNFKPVCCHPPLILVEVTIE